MTEPLYFRGFRLPTVHIEGLGYNTVSLVERARELRDEDGDYLQVWCVFDHDSFSADDFNTAISRAGELGIQVAYSNEAFELWFYLHFHYLTTGLTRQDLCGKLSNVLGHPYRKADTNLYGVLLDKQPDALRNAKRLLGQYSPCNPAEDNPSTTVHLLVEELNRWIR